MSKMSSIDLQIRDGIERAMEIALYCDPELEDLEAFVRTQAEGFMNPIVASIWSEMTEEARAKLTKEVVSKLLH